jgi:hypothetical protein
VGQIIETKFELITLFCGVLIILSSSLYIILCQSQKRVLVNAFLNITGLLMVAVSLINDGNIDTLWLTMISVLSVVVIWSGTAHLYYRKGEKD